MIKSASDRNVNPKFERLKHTPGMIVKKWVSALLRIVLGLGFEQNRGGITSPGPNKATETR